MPQKWQLSLRLQITELETAFAFSDKALAQNASGTTSFSAS
jgi:hypothetical protein